MSTPEITTSTSNPFDAPVPGQSLTDTPGNYPWEHPPQFTDLNKAAEFVWDNLHEENKLEQISNERLRLETQYSNLVNDEKLILDELNEKYGPGNLDPDSGVFTPIK